MSTTTLESTQPIQIDHEHKQTPELNEPLQHLEKLLRTHYYKPDIQAVRIVLGTIVSHRLKTGDPAWLFVIAPPGAGKTTMTIMGNSGLPDVVMLGDFSENTFLSGFYGHSQPGMLEKLGHTNHEGQTFTTQGDAVFLAKDFTTVLSMRREKRAAILGQLREIHDGLFKRDFGTGVTKIWRGRLTMIAAVTPVLDKHYSTFSVLGERFLQVRWHRPDSEEAGIWAIRQQGHEDEIQQEIRDVFRQVFENALAEPPELPVPMQHRIASLAEIVAIARTHVFRNSYGNREIEYAPEPEANTRLSKGLAAISKGIAALQGRRVVQERDLQDAFRVGLDCLKPNRSSILECLARGAEPKSLPISKTTLQRELEEMEELRIVQLSDSGYQFTDKIERLWGRANVR